MVLTRNLHMFQDIFEPKVEKYGIRDYRGGGRQSARETACRVAAGAVAKIILKRNLHMS